MKIDTQIPILAYEQQELIKLLESHGKRAFHGRQIYAWLYRRCVTEFNEMTDLAKDLRTILNNNYIVGMPRLLEKVSGDTSDSATKYLFELEDKSRVETVFIPSEDRNTLCLSSQVGCAYGCTFCATGKLGLKRNMTVAEIIGTYLAVRQDREERISNVVFMGMGEPLANLNNVISAWHRLTDPDGIGMSKRRVTISTVGIPKRIRELAEIPNPPKLVFSIGSPYDEIRAQLLPVAGKISLEENYQALKYYATKTRHRITIAFLTAKDHNDSIEDARKLHRWIRDLPVKINILRYNEAAGDFKRPDENKVEAVAAELVRLGRNVVLRRSRGRDVAAACGQLAGKKAEN